MGDEFLKEVSILCVSPHGFFCENSENPDSFIIKYIYTQREIKVAL